MCSSDLLVVLDGDPFTEPPERIADIPIWTTILGGEPVFTAEA